MLRRTKAVAAFARENGAQSIFERFTGSNENQISYVNSWKIILNWKLVDISATTHAVSAISLNHVIDWELGPRQGDRQRKQQDGPIDQWSDTHQERSRQVDEPRQLQLIYNYLLSPAATPGKWSFWRRQQLLPKCRPVSN